MLMGYDLNHTHIQWVDGRTSRSVESSRPYLLHLCEIPIGLRERERKRNAVRGLRIWWCVGWRLNRKQ